MKRVKQAIYFFQRVVLNKADAQHSAFMFHLKTLRQIERIVIAVPGEDAASGEEFGDRPGRTITDAERESRAAFFIPRRIGDAVDAKVRNRPQAFDELCDQAPLVAYGSAEGGCQRFAPGARRCITVTSHT